MMKCIWMILAACCRRSLLLLALAMMALSPSPSLGHVLAAPYHSPFDIVIETTDGGLISGRLVKVAVEFLEISTADQTQTIDLQNVARVIFDADSDDRPKTQRKDVIAYCHLTDGSMIAVAAMESNADQLVIQTPHGEVWKIGRNNVDQLLFFDSAEDVETRVQWDAFLPTFDQPSDAIVAKKSDDLQAVEGVVGEVSSDTVVFVMGDREVPVKRSKLTGVLFYRADRELAALLCKVALRDGSVINAQQAVLLEGRIELVTLAGERISVAPADVETIDYSSGRAVYLSDLIPTTNDWKPLLASSAVRDNLRRLHTAQVDRSFSGEPLSLRLHPSEALEFLSTTNIYDKGIAIDGGGRISFTLNGQFKRLTGLVGFDPETEDLPGTVKVFVQVDGQQRVAQRLENRNLASPFALDVDVVGAQRLVIKVDYEDGRSIGDRVHIVNAKVSR